jgi:hypothetical protein
MTGVKRKGHGGAGRNLPVGNRYVEPAVAEMSLEICECGKMVEESSVSMAG